MLLFNETINCLGDKNNGWRSPRALCNEKRLTVICRLHQVHLAKKYGDRILGMRAGQIILDVPATAFNDDIANTIYQ
ncbi:hypothetical protein AWQ21_15660 (plasmid) [Picosynechococcus sp. PCC 7003]|uniref:hypothetical protein n=1 Tax=Picosynechococcus sp. PCC 7003 TaxID=374981 RepID=UPI000810827A|nr:hypothetical protein [Picosynechococcus sp. PCC 7003]ANV85958.1 hypothetical protein AWQ21_15660 [Picosynechococcus sp. PCC 7003]